MLKRPDIKGYNKCTAFDKLVEPHGWQKVQGEHRYRTGPVFRTCNIFGFDRLYATPSGPVLVEVTTADLRAGHRREILERLEKNPLILKNFVVILAVYYGGHKKLDKRTDKKVWTKGGTWDTEVL